MANRDRFADAATDNSQFVSREEAMSDVDFRVGTLADEARMDAAAGRPTAGTASDYADVTGDIHRRK